MSLLTWLRRLYRRRLERPDRLVRCPHCAGLTYNDGSACIQCGSPPR